MIHDYQMMLVPGLLQTFPYARADDVSVRIAPFGSSVHPGMDGPFVIMEYQDLPSLILLENKCNDLYLDEKADVRTYTLALQGIKAAAYSKELIAEIADRLS